MSQVKFLCRLADIADGAATAATLETADGPVSVIVLREGEGAVAYYNECPHAGRNLDYAPGKFLVSKGKITCAVHGACFAVQSGEYIAGPGGGDLVTLSVEIIEGEVWASA